MEVNRLAQSTGRYVLDGVMSVIDVENWKGYDDVSYTAKVQAKYTDLIVLNKWELVSERRLEDVEDAILALEIDPPTPRTKSDKGWVDKDIIFGLDAKLAKQIGTESSHHHDHDHQSEVEVLDINLKASDTKTGVDVDKLRKLLEEPTRDEIYRIKGVLYASTPPKSSAGAPDTSSTSSNLEVSRGPSRFILNWAFGRWTFTAVPPPSTNTTPSVSGSATPVSSERTTPPASGDEPALRLTVITAKYEANKWKKEIEGGGLIALEGGIEGVLAVERTL
ncbi:hypothetical protein M011DRAFT_465696 [Sporormia fimetaria CBS 119925]|uniref:CobW/HypB/UreG nucleotide-binding domain-containing protein n=1 Tax=Sporormia fimetaria CBS 119925 TaxID=1340428 RepID=A0A6A6VHR8_9PLEO|nr:hypothetical protein M011DRAFT_465696 [Sporormia fimetaria CBS 119925]